MAAAKRPGMRHRNAVKRLLSATGLRNVPEEAPLVALLEDLAREMDYGGGTRTRAEYLSALKDVRRVLNGGSSRPVGGTSEPSAAKRVKAAAALAEAEDPGEQSAPVPNELAEFRAKRGIGP